MIKIKIKGKSNVEFKPMKVKIAEVDFYKEALRIGNSKVEKQK